jgi:hydroxyacylglutathione hydrolase
MRRLTELTAGVLVGTSELYVTNSTVVVGRDGGCLVIDPAVTVADIALLAADLEVAGLRPVAAFATHSHWDHILWSGELGDVPRYASALAVATAERESERLIQAVQEEAPGHDLGLFGRLVPLRPGAPARPGNGPRDIAPAEPLALPWDGPLAQVLTHDAHAPGHSALFFPETGTLVAGDMLSDVDIPLLDLDQEDPLGDYRAGLDLLASLPVRELVPGHGAVADTSEFLRRVTADETYLDQLARGDEPADRRLTQDWLIAAHDQQVKQLRPCDG